MMRVLVYGLGSIGQRHIKNLNIIYKNVKFATTSKIDNRKLIGYKKIFKNKLLSNEYEIKYLANSKEIKLFDPNLILITNDSSLHIKTLLPYLNKDIYIFIEKPLAINASDLKKLNLKIKNSRAFTAVGYQTRFHPCVKYIEDYLKKNKKRIIHSNFNWETYLPDHRPWQNYKKSYVSLCKKGGGAIHSLSHEIDLIYNFFGTPISLIAFENDKIINIEADENISSLINYKNFSVSLNLSLSSNIEKRYFSILTENEKIFCDLRKNFVKIERFDKKKLMLKKFKFKPNDLLITEMYNFLKLSSKNNTFPLSVNKIKDVSKIALTMHKSIKEKKLVKL